MSGRGRVTVRIRAKMGNSGSDYQQAANFPHKIMVVRTLTKKTVVMRRRKSYKKTLKQILLD